MVGWSGFTLTGEEADEGFNELGRGPRLMSPKSYAVYQRLCSSEPPSSPLCGTMAFSGSSCYSFFQSSFHRDIYSNNPYSSSGLLFNLFHRAFPENIDERV
jgi:hypothetical protein